MHGFGLHTMGDVASMSQDLLMDQFGPPGRSAWNLSHGIDDSPLAPLKYEESIVEHTSLPFPSTSMELLLVTAENLLSEVPAELDVHLIADNYATHKTALLRNWFARRPRFHIHFTPTSASWLNLVERWFGLLTEKQLRRGVHQSSAELEAAIYLYLDVTNEDPKPFVWTKTADQTLASVARFCQRTLFIGGSRPTLRNRRITCPGKRRRLTPLSAAC